MDRGLSAGSPPPGGRHHGRFPPRSAPGTATPRAGHLPQWLPRTWDTRVGTMELHIPKLREGSYFPSLLEPRRRSEQGRHPASLCRRRVHPAGGRSDQGPGLRRHLQQPGVAHLRATGRSGGEFPGSAPGRWSLPLRVAGRPDPAGSGGRSHRQLCVVVATGVNAEGQREIWVWTWAPARTARSGWPSCGR